MKMSKKLAALAVAALMCFSACGTAEAQPAESSPAEAPVEQGGQTETPQATPQAETETAPAAETAPAKEEAVQETEEAAPEAVTYPIVTDGSVTLTYYTPLMAAASKFISSYNENFAYQKMQELTGIKLEFIHPATGQEQEQFNMMLVSGDLPDIIASADNMYRGGMFQGMADGMYVDLTDYIPTLAPDYNKIIQEDEEFHREITNDIGQIVAFCGYKPAGDPPHLRGILRTEMLEEFGIEVPQTIAEYEVMFQMMLDKGITPYIMAQDLSGYEPQFLGAYQVLASKQGNSFYKDENGQIHFGNIEPGFREYLTLMNSWYTKGYLSKDFTSTPATQCNTLFDVGDVGMVIGAVVANYNRTEALGIEITATPHPRVNLGDQLHYDTGQHFPRMIQWGECTAAISTSCENVEAAVKFMNYGYTQEGADLLNWGVEGVNWDWVDGKRVYNDTMLNNPKFGTEEASYIYKVHFAPKYNYNDVDVHANLLKSPGALASRMWYADAPNEDSDFLLPPFQLSAEALDRRTEIMSDIATYADENMLRFITGELPISEFDTYVEDMKAMGIDEAIQLTQEAYDAYTQKQV